MLTNIKLKTFVQPQSKGNCEQFFEQNKDFIRSDFFGVLRFRYDFYIKSTPDRVRNPVGDNKIQ